MSCFALLLCFLTTALSAAPPYPPTDQILMCCGSESSIKDDNERSWDDDAHSKYAPPNIATTSIASAPTEQVSSVLNSAPYTRARIFQSQFTYTFPVLAGPKFLRLYFFSATYSGLDKNVSFNKNESFFTVTANEFTLLSNFKIPYFRDYVTWVSDDGRHGERKLNLSLFPNTMHHPLYNNALLNGLEIFKLSNSSHSLAAANLEPILNSSPPGPDISQLHDFSALPKGERLEHKCPGVITGPTFVHVKISHEDQWFGSIPTI
ncbi:unnamed protein product [Fraxinus pennsylvanica]|uniref:Malectin-like domain-containing protein n=1 Tax=Fraxinus pennsylvanica TaxID=56036 RepID=A0AAD1YWJ5_9LAMI|nr:unnamed protein product [Fraxinus pennsylvanica]